MASEEQPKAILSDVEVEEVSLVDRAANKKKFLVVKSEGGSEGGAPETGAPPPLAAPEPSPAVPFGWSAAQGTGAAAVSAPDPVQKEAAVPAEGEGKAEKVEKRGAKMAKERLSRLASAVDELAKIVSELQDEVSGDSGEEGDGKTTEEAKKVEKSASSETNPLSAQVEQLTKTVADLTATVASQAKEIAGQRASITKQAEIIKAAQLPPPPNSTAPEGFETPGAPSVVWGSDLNAGRSSSKSASKGA